MRLIDAETLHACGVGPADAVLAGFSGGADSTALVHALLRCKGAGLIAELFAAHLNHGLRGAAAEADEAFCRAFCQDRGITFFAERVDVPSLAKASGKSDEEAGRDARYAFLRSCAKACGASCIAVAHHRGDQAETLLLRLMRGTGPSGLAGIRPRSGDIVRPLLFRSRAEIEAYLAENGLTFCTDETNFAPDAAERNRVRHVLIPAMEAINPRAGEHLAHVASLLAADEDFLADLAGKTLAEAAMEDGGYDRRRLAAAPAPLRMRALAMTLRPLLADVKASDLRRVDALLTARTGVCIELAAGRAAWVDANALHLGLLPKPQTFCVPFVREGITRFPGGRFFAKRTARFAKPVEPNEACVDADALPDDAVVRTRLPGDRFYPLGAPGMKKLSDFFIDKKLPKTRRDLPLLASGNEILFVPGFTVSERLRARENTDRLLCISYYKEEPSI